MDYGLGEKAHEAWWLADADGVAKCITDHVRFLSTRQEYERETLEHHLRMYSERLYQEFIGGDYTPRVQSLSIKHNVVRSVIDTLTSHIGAIQPKPRYLTDGGSHEAQEQAKKLTQFVPGIFYEQDLYRKALKSFLDAGITGTGFLKVFADSGRINIERVFPHEILVDNSESRFNEPSSLYQIKEVSKSSLKAIFNGKGDEEKIDTASRIRDLDRRVGSGNVDIVHVIEAWHIGPDGEGRHVICVDTGVLEDCDNAYKKDYFPFAMFTPTPVGVGFKGTGYAEVIDSIQLEINYLGQKAQTAMRLQSVGLWVPKGSEMNQRRPDNRMGFVNYYRGDKAPMYVAPPALHESYFRRMAELKSEAFQLAGVSQLASSSLKPAGLDSGAALREYSDIGSARFAATKKLWEQFIARDVSELVVKSAEDVISSGGSLKTLGVGEDDKKMQEIDFKEARIENSKFVTKVWPVSILPDTPAGKIQAVMELARVMPDYQSNLIGLLDFPDINAQNELSTAKVRIIDKQLDAMLIKGEPQMPQPYFDLASCIDRGTMRILDAEDCDTPEERLQLVRSWLGFCVEMQIAAAPPQPMAAPPGGAPTAEAPMPPPTQGPPIL